MKVLLVGPSGVGKSRLLQKFQSSKGLQWGQEGPVRVLSTSAAGRSVAVFEVSDPFSISAQAFGTEGLILMLDPHQRKMVEGLRIYNLIETEQELTALPLVVLFKNVCAEGIAPVKDLHGVLGPYKLRTKDAAFFSVNLDRPGNYENILQWIARFQSNKLRFEAFPQVVRQKPKYSEQEWLEPEPGRLEQRYIQDEMRRQTDEHIKKEMGHFLKHKGTIRPYQIKGLPKPRVEPNLEFFLTDNRQRTRSLYQRSAGVLTEELKDRPDRPARARPVGINRATQIEQNQLFDFEKMVEPIIDVVTSKVYQAAMLQLEEQDELQRYQALRLQLCKLKIKVTERESTLLQQEAQAMAEKEQRLAQARLKKSKRDQVRRRLKNYAIAGQYLSTLKDNTLELLTREGFYPDEFGSQLKTSFLESLLSGTVRSVEKKLAQKDVLAGLFTYLSQQQTARRAKALSQKESADAIRRSRRLNYSSSGKRYVHLLHFNSLCRSSYFSSSFSKIFSGAISALQKLFRACQHEDAPRSTIESQAQIAQQSLQQKAGQFKKELGPRLCRMVALIPALKYAFCSSQSPFFRNGGNRRLQMMVKQVRKYQYCNPDTSYLTLSSCEYDPLLAFNWQNCCLIDLRSVPKEVTQLHLFVKLLNVNEMPTLLKELKHSYVCVQHYQYNLPLCRSKLLPLLKAQPLIDHPAEPQAQSQRLFFMYRLFRAGAGWAFEDVGQETVLHKVQSQEKVLTAIATRLQLFNQIQNYVQQQKPEDFTASFKVQTNRMSRVSDGRLVSVSSEGVRQVQELGQGRKVTVAGQPLTVAGLQRLTSMVACKTII